MATTSTADTGTAGTADTMASAASTTASAGRVSETPLEGEALRAQVRSRYGAIAQRVSSARAGSAVTADGAGDSCCEPTCCGDDDGAAVSVIAPEVVAAGAATAAGATGAAEAAVRADDPITSKLYSAEEAGALPEEAVLASLGCGNPTALADLRPGETVLDLGSGGGIDVLLSARRVGPTGFAFGLDMTDEMLALANTNKEKAGAKNVTFLKGTIEEIPLPSGVVDVVISNCVINLSSDKGQVLREAFRVLKPGGRLAVSDVVVQGDLPPALRKSMELWAGCIGGALEEETYKRLLSEAGYTDIGVEVTRVYDANRLASSSEESGDDEDGGDGEECCGPSGAEQLAAFEEFTAVGGRLVSAFVRATKPVG